MTQQPFRRSNRAVRTLIDGYNLMFTYTGSPDPRDGASALRIARNRLLELLASRMTSDECLATCVVFDSSTQLELPIHCSYRGMEILFARDYPNADELICELIRKHPHPKGLTVVSSEHQVQKVARSKKATFFDGEDWISKQAEQSDNFGPGENDQWGLDGYDSELDARVEEVRNSIELDDAQKKKWLDEFGY